MHALRLWFSLAGLLLLAAPAIAAEALLADAAEQKDSASVRTLLKQSADVNAAQPDGMTALHWAVWHDDAPTAMLLLEAGADARAANRYGVQPLSLACMNGNVEIIEALLDAGADPNATLAGGETALMTAARTGRLRPVEALLAHGADVNAAERRGQTALMWAAAEGHVEVVDALLDAGAEFQTPLPSGFTPLFFAVREGRFEVVKRLLDAGADVNEAMEPRRGGGRAPRRGTSPLMLAVENGHFELALALLETGADPNDQRSGFTPLHAITWVRKPIRGDGDPPPIGSGDLSSLDFVRHLVAHGADVDARLKKGTSGRGRFNMTGSTPFMLAARASDVPLMRLLVELGADPHRPNAVGCTPLLAAAGVGALGDGDESAGTEDEAIEAVRLLLDLGADVNAVDENGETAMHGAAYQSWPRLAQLLAERGADITAWHQKNKWGWTPLLIAQGHRPGNFRPSPETIAAISRIMLARGVVPPEDTLPHDKRDWKE